MKNTIINESVFKSKSYIAPFLFVIVFFVSPLIFFTDLTRNPYYFQLAILNIATSFILTYVFYSFYLRKKLILPQSKIFFILLILLLEFLISSVFSYFMHQDFFKPALISEFKRQWLFTIINCLFPFLIAFYVDFEDMEINYKKILIFIFIWGIMWFFFPFLKSNYENNDLFYNFWDFYGFILWGFGIYIAFSLVKKINHENIMHLIMVTSILASMYGILQYFGIEFIWAKLINPYGRRAVSTFGNPNFISSYVLMILPISLYYLLKTKDKAGKLFYLITLMTALGMIFASLTRSSLIGLIVSLVFLFSFKEYRSGFEILKNKFSKNLLVLVVLILFLWPDQNMKPFSLGVFSRLYEGFRGSSKITLNLKKDEIYPSFHQRLLIWSSGYAMFLENPALGKGWGSYELFYPYYQGPIIKEYPQIMDLRTHANNAHNEILEILTQTGILGFGLYSLFFISIFYFSFLYIKQSDAEEKKYIIAILASILAMITYNMLNVSMHLAVPAFLFWWLLGILNKKLSNKSIIDSKKISILSFLLIISFSIYSSNLWISQFMREVHYFNGFKMMRKNLYFEASKELLKAYKWHNSEVNNNYELANAFAKVMDYNQAEKYYIEALKANSGYDEIFFNLAIIQNKMGKKDDAISNLRTSLWINPVNILAYKAILDLYMSDSKKYSREAMDTIKQAIKIYPYEPLFYSIGGYLSRLNNDREGEISFYEKGLLNNPMDRNLIEMFKKTLSYYNISSNKVLNFSEKCYKIDYLIDKNPEDAAAMINDCEHKDSYIVKYLKAKLLFKKGDYISSEELLHEVLNENPDFNPASYGLMKIKELKK